MREELTKINLSNAEYYGFENQKNQLIEEMAELMQALNKYSRACGNGQPARISKEDAFNNVVEEIADVEVMLHQIKHFLEIDESILGQYRRMKIMRTHENIFNRKKSIKSNFLAKFNRMT